MISKEKFVEIINKMKLVDDFINETNEKVWQLREELGGSYTDFFDSHTLFVAHDELVVNLLEDMFNDKDIISWWIYEIDFGRKFKIGDLSFEKDGKIFAPDISTTEKLYDFLIKEMEEK